MNTKEKSFSIIVIVLISAILIVGYFISRLNYQHSSLTEKNATIAKYKASTTEVFKNKPIKKQSSESTSENVNASALVNNLNLKYNDIGIPVLMYHSIGYEQGNTARVSKEKFREQMKYLKDNSYVTLTLDQAYNFFVDNKPIPEKSLVITFDDGYVDNYVEALPILKEFGFKATFFIITDLVDKNSDYMNLEQLKEMDAYEMDIESHTVNHEHLKQLTYKNQVKTLKESKEFLQKSLNKKVQYLAYPYGEYSKETVTAAKEVGYKMVFSTNGRWSDKSDGIFTLDRVFISGAASLDVFIERISNPNYKF